MNKPKKKEKLSPKRTNAVNSFWILLLSYLVTFAFYLFSDEDCAVGQCSSEATGMIKKRIEWMGKAVKRTNKFGKFRLCGRVDCDDNHVKTLNTG